MECRLGQIARQRPEILRCLSGLVCVPSVPYGQNPQQVVHFPRGPPERSRECCAAVRWPHQGGRVRAHHRQAWACILMYPSTCAKPSCSSRARRSRSAMAASADCCRSTSACVVFISVTSSQKTGLAMRRRAQVHDSVFLVNPHQAVFSSWATRETSAGREAPILRCEKLFLLACRIRPADSSTAVRYAPIILTCSPECVNEEFLRNSL